MNKAILAATLLAGTAIATLPAQAASITLGSTPWTTDGASTLDLVLAPPPGNQPQNNPCLICGTNQPGQPANFGFNNYKQSGSETSFIEFSSATVGDKLDQDTLGTGYDVSFLKGFLTSQNFNGFNVGIDVNTAQGSGPEVLEAFAILDLTTKTVLAQYSLLDGVGTPLPTINNGNGFPDYLLTGFDINLPSIVGDQIVFYSRWSNTSDGPESFFLVATPGPIAGAGIPGLFMALGGMVGLNRYRRRRQAA